MQYIVYVSNIAKNSSEFKGYDWVYMVDSQELIALEDDLNLKVKGITCAMVTIINGDYDEIWVSYTNTPYSANTTYHKVIRYYRNWQENAPSIDNLPHGSGIDGQWYKHTAYKFSCSYHVMDDVGSYCGWLDFTIQFDRNMRDFTLTFTDRKYEIWQSDYDAVDGSILVDILPELKEHLEDTFAYWLQDWNKKKNSKRGLHLLTH